MALTLKRRWRFLGLIASLAFAAPFGVDVLHGAEKTFTNSLGMQFILVMPGGFIMGSPPNEPDREVSEKQHQVTLSRPFYMQATEVTLGHWRALMGKRWMGGRPGPENMPVARVSWFDCIQFLDKLNDLGDGFYRLPTEAEWEYACRAGTSDAYPWGKEIDCRKAMFGNSSQKDGPCVRFSKSRGFDPGGPAPVGSYSPNSWGFFDMPGNVWEWCQDWYGEYPSSAVQDPGGPETGTAKVRRGGSWLGPGATCRSANRAHAHPGSRFSNTGLRIVREVR